MVPFVDLRAQHHTIKDELQTAIGEVLESCQFVLGAPVAEFEQEFAAYCGTHYAVGVNSGTSALHLALLAAGIGLGDEVITTPFTFIATIASIQYAGARPVLADIEPRSFNIDPRQIEAAITPRTKAIVPVHLYGQTAHMEPILDLARTRGLVVIEDAAQAHGAEYEGRRAGSLADLACFSFYPVKNLGACGEGGAVTTNDPEYDRNLRMLRNWGAERKYEHLLKGYNYRMDGLQGAVLRVKLRHAEAWTEARRAHAKRYGELLGAATAPVEMPYARHVYHAYTIRTPRRAELQAALRDAGVETAIHYPVPAHLQPAYTDLGYRRGDFPEAEKAAAEVLSLPIFPEMTAQQIETVAAAVAAFRAQTVGA